MSFRIKSAEEEHGDQAERQAKIGQDTGGRCLRNDCEPGGSWARSPGGVAV